MDPVTRWALNWCISNHVPFCAFREPGKDNVDFYSAPSLLKNTEGVQTNRFFIGEFNQPFAESYFIPMEYDAQQTLEVRPYGPKNGGKRLAAVNTDHEYYIESVGQLIDDLHARGIAKTVISRMTVRDGRLPAADAFEYLTKRANNLFCSCCFHPKAGYWLGATPEIMLEADKASNKFHTVALAGTKATDEAWDEKNIQEQTIVSDYIAHALNGLGADFSKSEMHNMDFGSLQHLATDFNGCLNDLDAAEIINALNPTPALCGYPKEQALADIAKIEKQPRGCYGGVIGFQRGSVTKAYVNIRSIHFGPTKYVLRAGGGILADSNPEAEWQETDRKITNLLKLINIE